QEEAHLPPAQGVHRGAWYPLPAPPAAARARPASGIRLIVAGRSAPGALSAADRGPDGPAADRAWRALGERRVARAAGAPGAGRHGRGARRRIGRGGSFNMVVASGVRGRVDVERFRDEGYLVVEDVLDVERDLEPVVGEYTQKVDELARRWHAE